MEYIIIFESTNLAIKAEQNFLDNNLHAGVFPLPPQIKAGCGITLRIRADEIRSALDILDKLNIHETSLYTRTLKNGVSKPTYTEITDKDLLVQEDID